ncbi:MAG: phosphate/phosphite/phosphonate ABC transporter substrate-binding protein [Candidatus Wenzhouxiangella sp. M2_3B_020]
MKGGNPIARPMLMAACAVVLAACCPGEEVDERGWPNELVLGLVPALEAEALVDNLDPLADYLEVELGVPVRTFVPQDYTGLVEALGAGRADIGMLPPFAAMLGQRRYDLEPILISTRRGEVGYRTQWMTNDPAVCDGDVVIEERLCETRVRGRDAVTRNFASCDGDIRQVRGESVAFVDPNSTSGFLFPAVQLMEAGIDPQEDVNGLFVGGHDAAALAVYAGDTRFGVAYEDARMMICDQYADIGEKAIVFNYAPMIPNDGVQLRPGLPPDLKKAIADAFLNLAESQAHLPDDEKILWILYEIDGFQRFEPGLYDPVREAYEIVRQ